MGGIEFFFIETKAVGALNALFFMSLAVIFAVLAAFSIVKQKGSAKKMVRFIICNDRIALLHLCYFLLPCRFTKFDLAI